MKSYKLSLALLAIFASGSSSLQSMTGSASKAKVRTPQRKLASGKKAQQPSADTMLSLEDSIKSCQQEFDRANAEVAAKQSELKLVNDALAAKQAELKAIKEDAQHKAKDMQQRREELRPLNDRIGELQVKAQNLNGAIEKAQNAANNASSLIETAKSKLNPTSNPTQSEQKVAASEAEEGPNFHETPVKPKVETETAAATPAPTPVKEGDRSSQDSGIPANLHEQLAEAKRQDDERVAAEAKANEARAEAERAAAEEKRQAEALEAQRRADEQAAADAQRAKDEQAKADAKRSAEEKAAEAKRQADEQALADAQAKEAAGKADAQRLAAERAAAEAKATAEAEAAKIAAAYSPAKKRFIVEFKKAARADMVAKRKAILKVKKLEGAPLQDIDDTMAKLDVAALYDELIKQENYKKAVQGYKFAFTAYLRNGKNIRQAIADDNKALRAFVASDKFMTGVTRSFNVELEADNVIKLAEYANKTKFGRALPYIFNRRVAFAAVIAMAAGYMYSRSK